MKRSLAKTSESYSRKSQSAINHRARLSPRGVLALVVNPSLRDNSAFSTSTASSHNLTYFSFNPTASRLSNRKRRRKVGDENEGQIQMNTGYDGFDVENQFGAPIMEVTAGKDQGDQTYHPSNGEFTLLYFYESHLMCKNSKRFTSILASFMNNIQNCHGNDDYDGIVPCQLICIPNYDDDSGRQSKQGGHFEPNILTHLSSEAYFWHLGVDHINRLAIIRMVSVSAVPALIVINNTSGSILTSWGMEAIECWSKESDWSNGKSNHQSRNLLDKWRRGSDGVSLCSKVAGVCAIL